VFEVVEKKITVMPVDREKKRMAPFLLFGNHSSKQKRAQSGTNATGHVNFSAITVWRKVVEGTCMYHAREEGDNTIGVHRVL
jgi:hypothetical protein